MRLIIALTLLFVTTMAVDDGDWVFAEDLGIGIPGRNFYAGYLKISKTKALYYVYTPSESNPTKDPLVIHISQGPGCSALYTWLYSHNDFIFTYNSSSFRTNPMPWQKEANVLYIEGPAGVGFSYGEDVNITEDSVQQDYFDAILKFY